MIVASKLNNISQSYLFANFYQIQDYLYMKLKKHYFFISCLVKPIYIHCIFLYLGFQLNKTFIQLRKQYVVHIICIAQWGNPPWRRDIEYTPITSRPETSTYDVSTTTRLVNKDDKLKRIFTVNMGFLYNVSKRLVLVGIAVLIGVYLNFPAPNMSDSLRLWVQSGQFFLHGVTGKGVKIFHKGSVWFCIVNIFWKRFCLSSHCH